MSPTIDRNAIPALDRTQSRRGIGLRYMRSRTLQRAPQVIPVTNGALAMSTALPAAPARLLLNVEETRQALGGISLKGLWNLSHREVDPLPSTKLGARVMYRISDIEAWLERQK